MVFSNATVPGPSFSMGAAKAFFESLATSLSTEEPSANAAVARAKGVDLTVFAPCCRFLGTRVVDQISTPKAGIGSTEASVIEVLNFFAAAYSRLRRQNGGAVLKAPSKSPTGTPGLVALSSLSEEPRATVKSAAPQ